MILRLHPGTPEATVRQAVERCESAGLRVMRSPEPDRPILALAGKLEDSLAKELEALPAVEALQRPTPALLRVARAFREHPSTVRIGNVTVGGPEVVVIAGPCSVEGRDIVRDVAERVRAAGAHLLRGGAFKPRTSPYAFQGFGVEGLRQLKDAGLAAGLPIVSEIMDAADLPAFVDHDVDCLQIGARNMQNFTLLKAVARSGRPVLLKRGLAATVEEWLYAAEYLAAGGCDQVILCERGIRTFERATRNTLDLTVLPLLREWTHLPVIVDPAHAAGIARLVTPLARAAVAAGSDGIAVEVHERPHEARSDAAQALLPSELAGMIGDLRVIGSVLGRRMHPHARRPAADAALAH